MHILKLRIIVARILKRQNNITSKLLWSNAETSLYAEPHLLLFTNMPTNLPQIVSKHLRSQHCIMHHMVNNKSPNICH